MLRMEQLARLHQKDLLEEAARGRLAEVAAGARHGAAPRRKAGSTARPFGLRRELGRLLVDAGTWLAGTALEREAGDAGCP